MIIASCRKRFDSTRFLAPRTQIRDYPDPARPGVFTPLELPDLQARAKNRHVGLLVHGFNTRLPDILAVYAEMQANMARFGISGPRGYGLVVGFAWPGWSSAPGFLAARLAANRAAPRLRQLVNDLRAVALSIDIQTHSLGARVALGALKNARSIAVDNLLLSAPAVDRTVLEPRRAFHSALDGCNRCLVYHSRRDRVLKLAYPGGDLADGVQPALGLGGPRSQPVTLGQCPNVYVIDCTACVADHSGYRRAEPYYAHWHRLLARNALPRYDKL